MNSVSLKEKPLLLCVMGPTAAGKTDLAVGIAQQLNCELISVDSALVYRHLDIGSAKPAFPHHLVDIRDPAVAYSAAEFVDDATALIADIIEREKIPLLVGGTMLYFKALLEGLDDIPSSDPAIRAEITAQAQQIGWPALHAQLAVVDPVAAQRIHPNHSQRLSRALEVYRSSGIPLSQWQHSSIESPDLKAHAGRSNDALGDASRPGLLDTYRIEQIAISPSQRSVLHQRIALRFDQMMAEGFLDEVSSLREREDLHLDLPAIRAVGYRQLWEHLVGECELDEAVEKAVAATRQLAKRQLTWLRKWPDLHWIYTDDEGNLFDHTLSHNGERCAGKSPLEVALSYIADAK